MKDVNELSKLASDMICRSLLEIINENSSVAAIEERVEQDEDFKNALFVSLKQLFPNEFVGTTHVTTHEDVVEFFKNPNLHRQEIMDILNEADIQTVVEEELEEGIIDCFFDNASTSEVIDRCPSIEDDFKDRAIDAIRDL